MGIEVGIPEFQELYFDIYDFDKGKFTSMSKGEKKAYGEDLKTFYKMFTGKNIKKPDVGFGVVGKKMLYKSLFFPNLVVTSPFVLVETKATAHIPFLGYSTRQALSNELFD